MSEIASIITSFEKEIRASGKKDSLRFTSGLLGVSHETVYRWKQKNGSVPSLPVLLESKALVVAAYKTIDKLIARISSDDTENLVVAEASE